MSPIIGHTSGTSSNTVCTEEDDDYDYGYGASTAYVSMAALISHTKKEYDHEDNNEDFHKFDKFSKELNKDSVHPDGKCYELCSIFNFSNQQGGHSLRGGSTCRKDISPSRALWTVG